LSSEKNVDDEISWLKNKIYAGKRASIELEKLGATLKHSQRQGEKTIVSL
jgi:hypothetical protein